jgi:hypothetical protein
MAHRSRIAATGNFFRVDRLQQHYLKFYHDNYLYKQPRHFYHYYHHSTYPGYHHFDNQNYYNHHHDYNNLRNYHFDNRTGCTAKRRGRHLP